jgi:hypothetical protein
MLKNETTMGRNGEKVVPRSYLIELFGLQNFTLKFLSSKPHNDYGIGFEQRLNG